MPSQLAVKEDTDLLLHCRENEGWCSVQAGRDLLDPRDWQSIPWIDIIGMMTC